MTMNTTFMTELERRLCEDYSLETYNVSFNKNNESIRTKILEQIREHILDTNNTNS